MTSMSTREELTTDLSNIDSMISNEELLKKEKLAKRNALRDKTGADKVEYDALSSEVAEINAKVKDLGAKKKAVESSLASLSTVVTVSVYKDYASLSRAVESEKFVARSYSPGDTMTTESAVAILRTPVEALILKVNTTIFGANFGAVTRATVKGLIWAREQKDYLSMVQLGLIAVGVAFGLSASYVDEYSKVVSPHFMSEFEIENRKAITIKIGDVSKNVTWMTSSKMNGHAMKVLGHLLVEAGSEAGKFKNVKELTGTMFSPPPIADESERAVLMRAASKELSDSDRKALPFFKDVLGPYASVMSAMFGAEGGGLGQLKTLASSTTAVMF